MVQGVDKLPSSSIMLILLYILQTLYMIIITIYNVYNILHTVNRCEQLFLSLARVKGVGGEGLAGGTGEGSRRG